MSSADSTDALPWIESGRIPHLDGLRAAAILMVIVSHVTHNEFRGSWSLGHFGVTLFFVISGFLITLLLIRERARFGSISIKSFYRRRVLRIFPAYIVFLLAIAALQWIGWERITGSSWLRAITYTSCFSAMTMSPVLAHTWSLSVEENFYLIWPLLFWALRPLTQVCLLIGYVLLSPVIRLLVLRTHSELFAWPYSSPTQMSSIALGCLLALFLASGRRLKPRNWILLGIALAGISLFAGRFEESGAALGDITKAAAAAAWMGALLGMSTSTLLGKILNGAAAVEIGVLSYSLYLWQQLFTDNRIAQWWGIPALFAVAWLSHRYVERPFLRLKDRQSAAERSPSLSVVHVDGVTDVVAD